MEPNPVQKENKLCPSLSLFYALNSSKAAYTLLYITLTLPMKISLAASYSYISSRSD